MWRTGEIRDVARVLLQAGFKPVHQRARIMRSPDPALVDELGFVAEKDCKRLYLKNRIDFGWLSSKMELLPPLKIDEASNVIYGDWWEICGGTEPSPIKVGQRPWWKLWT